MTRRKKMSESRKTGVITTAAYLFYYYAMSGTGWLMENASMWYMILILPIAYCFVKTLIWELDR